MAHRNKNLLEAFTASRADERTNAPQPKGTAPAAGGPFAASGAPQPAPKPQAQPRAAAPVAPAAARRAPSQERLVRELGIGAIVAIVFFFLGRWSTSGVAAAPGTDGSELQAGSGAGAVQPASLAPTSQASTPETALLDPKNRFTIVAAQYSLSASSKDIALAAQRYLVAQGFPAALPYANGKTLYLVVGAAQEMKDLDQLLGRLKRLPGPGGNPDDFKTALVMQIEQIVQR